MTNNNRILVVLLCWLMGFPALHAQNYTVYSVIGGVKTIQGKSTTPLKPRKQVSAQTRLLIEPESAVTLLDEKNNKMYSLASKGTYTVKQLIAQSKDGGKSLTKQYMSYLVKQLFTDGSEKMLHPDTYMQVTATSYRSESKDSMLMNKLMLMLPDSQGKSAEQLLCEPTTRMVTDLRVRFELISCESGLPMSNVVSTNTSSYVRVYNDSEEPLYVNVLNIDEQGNKYLVLPVDAAATCAHLLVPAMSTVSFKSEPFIFSDVKSKEVFLMLATEDPVDFSILMNPICKGAGKVVKSGIYRQFYQVK